jgi:hypothetical protein
MGHDPGAMRSAITAHLRSGQVGRVVYGAIIGLALVVSLEVHPPESGNVVAALLATAFAVGLAEVYSETIGASVRRDGGERERLPLVLEDGIAVAAGIAFPSIFFILAGLGLIERDTAFTLAKWTGLALVGFYGFCAARLSGAGTGRALLQALAVGLIGAVLIALKALLH